MLFLPLIPSHPSLTNPHLVPIQETRNPPMHLCSLHDGAFRGRCKGRLPVSDAVLNARVEEN